MIMELTTERLPVVMWTLNSAETAPSYTNNITGLPEQSSVQSPPPSSIYFAWVVLTMGVFGTLANGLMLVVLAYFKKNREQPTNKLILNQTALDVLSCVALAISYALQIARPYFNNDIGGYVFCDLLGGNILYAMGLSGSPTGLVVIAVERYFKIVHVVIHRRFYRPWMLYAGIALPWVYSAITQAPPAIVATIIVNGECLNLAHWPHPQDSLNYGIFMLMSNYILPVLIFAYCYGRIAHVIRGRLTISPASVSTEASQQTNRTAQADRTSAKQRNVIKTMVIISVTFTVCWLPIQVNFALFNAGYDVEIKGDSYLLLTCNLICYINMVLNPLMYAWQYETVRESIRVLLRNQTRGGSEQVYISRSLDMSPRFNHMPSTSNFPFTESK